MSGNNNNNNNNGNFRLMSYVIQTLYFGQHFRQPNHLAE
jgi:hypothetical protein